MVTTLDRLIGRSPGIVEVRAQLARLSASPLEEARRRPPILVVGETGTGKRLVAEVIHRIGSRVDAPFVHIDCAANPHVLVATDLMAH
jgi:DNA-binding NtrC family response regulator